MRSQAAKCLVAAALFWISAALSQETLQPPPGLQYQGQLAPSEIAWQWYLTGDAADRAGNKQEALHAYEEAIKAYRKAISLVPAFPGFWRKLGFVYWMSGQKDQAIAAYKEAVRLQPDDAESHQMLGDIQLGEPGIAIQEYRQAVQLKPTNAKYRQGLGLALSIKGDFDAAVAEFQEAARLDPKDGESHAYWGEVLQKKGDINGAAFEYLRAFTLDPKSTAVTRAFQQLLVASLTDSIAARVRQRFIALQKKSKDDEDIHYWIDRAKDWRKAVAQHNPGAKDEAAVTIGAWPIRDLEVLIGIISEHSRNREYYPIPEKLRTVFRVFRRDGQSPGQKDYAEYKAVLDSFVPSVDPNSILKRGALLHADIVMLQLDTGSGYFAFLKDGLGTATAGSRHWEFARLLLDSVSPAPSQDEMVRQWYIATTAYMMSKRQWAYAEENLTRALEIFPFDSTLLFYAGALHETYAAPEIQNALLPMPPPGQQYKFRFGSRELELIHKVIPGGTTM
jgi:tetratricopeptide (TPR) repeat protein